VKTFTAGQGSVGSKGYRAPSGRARIRKKKEQSEFAKHIRVLAGREVFKRVRRKICWKAPFAGGSKIQTKSLAIKEYSRIGGGHPSKQSRVGGKLLYKEGTGQGEIEGGRETQDRAKSMRTTAR